VGPIFGEQQELALRHHALESGCFVVNATAWLDADQIASVCPEESMREAVSGGCYTAIIRPDGRHVSQPLYDDGPGRVIGDLDLSLIDKRKRMMDSVGHYARPELLSLRLDTSPHSPVATTAASTATSEEQTHGESEPRPSHGDAVARTATG